MPQGRAVVLDDWQGELRVEDVEWDPPGPGEVLVRMVASGVCHTDEHVITGDLPLPVPMVLGHEGAGRVEQVGEGVTAVRPGDPVVLSWLPACGTCEPCRRGWVGMCEKSRKAAEKGTLWDGTTRVHGAHGPLHVMSLTGTLASYAVVPQEAVIPLPGHLPLRAAALLGCSAVTGYGAVVHTAELKAGERVAVIGAGGVGIQVILASRLKGASQVIAVDPLPARLAAARSLGATAGIHPEEEDPLERILDLTEGYGVDAAFEVVGRPDTIALAFNAIRPGGRAVVVGVAPPHAEVCLNAFAFPSQGKRLLGCWYGGGDLRQDAPALIEAYDRGELPLDRLTGTPYDLEDAAEAFEALRRGDRVRPLVSISFDLP